MAFQKSELAVVLVDMQGGFLKKLSLSRREKLVAEQQKILRHCVENEIFIAVLEFTGYGETIEELQHALHGAQHLAIIRKGYNNGFLGTNLHETLQSRGAKRLLFLGVNASFCVLETAQSAAGYGYKIITGRHLTLDAYNCHTPQFAFRWFRKNGHVLSPKKCMTALA